VARAEPAGGAQRGGEVRAGRGAGEDAFGAGGPAGGLERLGFGDRDDLVVIGAMEQRRVPADAAALDMVGPGRPARQHSRFAGLDDDPVKPGQLGGQRAADAQKTAGGPDIAAERADLRRAGELIEQFPAQPAVPVRLQKGPALTA